MADKLTQLQDAVDELANQFVASLHYLNTRHDLSTLGPGDVVREIPASQPAEVEPLPADVFKKDQITLARDLIIKEQQVEYLISTLPGLESSERDQEERIKELEGMLEEVEVRRKKAAKEKEEVLERLEAVIRGVRRPR